MQGRTRALLAGEIVSAFTDHFYHYSKAKELLCSEEGVHYFTTSLWLANWK